MKFYEKSVYDTLNEPLSADLEIFDFSKITSATGGLLYLACIEEEQQHSLVMPLRDAKFLLRNFLVRQFEWDLPYPSKICLP